MARMASVSRRMCLVSAILLSACAMKGTFAFKKITAEEVWQDLNPGWNLGNTLDAVPDEGSWNNPKVMEHTFDDIKGAKFKSVRIPVTWAGHFETEAPDYVVNKTWLDRVETVVDYSLSRGFYTVLNVHHDSWQWADYSLLLSDPVAYASTTTKFVRLWEQISERFANKSELLIFEPLNEPAGPSTEEVAEKYNILNQIFVDIVRTSGGHNADRLLTIPGLNTNIKNTVDWWKEPAGVGNYILHVHDYDPWPFVAGWWGRTMWGSEADMKEIEDTFRSLRGKYNGAPTLCGEWGVTEIVEKGASWRYFDFMMRKAREYKIAMQLWDNGADHFDRISRTWRDPTRHQIIIAAAAGINNTLPVYGQEPVFYFRKGEEVLSGVLGGKEVELDFVGNTITGVYVRTSATTTGRRWLTSGRDYQVTEKGLKFTEEFLLQELSSKPSELGALETMYVVPNRGATFDITLRRYATPIINLPPAPKNTTAEAILSLNSTAPYLIPVSWQGTTLATIKAVFQDTGLPVKDDWTVVLGPLEAARMNWNDDFQASAEGVTLTENLLKVLKGRTTELTLEYWPRIAGNNGTVIVQVA